MDFVAWVCLAIGYHSDLSTVPFPIRLCDHITLPTSWATPESPFASLLLPGIWVLPGIYFRPLSFPFYPFLSDLPSFWVWLHLYADESRLTSPPPWPSWVPNPCIQLPTKCLLLHVSLPRPPTPSRSSFQSSLPKTHLVAWGQQNKVAQSNSYLSVSKKRAYLVIWPL